MTTEAIRQLGLMVLEALLVGGLLHLLFSLRHRIGLTALYIAVGTFQYLQVILAISVYVEILPGLFVSPGSAVLFTSTISAVLMVYLREDAAETRSLVYGLLIANTSLTLLSSLFALHFSSPLTRNFIGLPEELFLRDVRVMAVGTVAFVIDVLLVVVLYEAFSRIWRGSLLLRIGSTLTSVLAIDSLLFVTGAFVEQPDYSRLLVANLTGKLFVGLIFTVMMTVYLRLRPHGDRDQQRPADLLDLLTYRQRFEQLQGQLARDPLTGLFNRGFFDEILPLELARARRATQPMSLLLLDLDRFKAINDGFGHDAGDRVLKLAAACFAESLRRADAACRVGGEEFAVILSRTGLEAAVAVAEKLRSRLKERAAEELGEPLGAMVTVTVGVASSEEVVDNERELVRLADRRLYLGKDGGRDRVVGTSPPESGPKPSALDPD